MSDNCLNPIAPTCDSCKWYYIGFEADHGYPYHWCKKMEMTVWEGHEACLSYEEGKP